MVTPPHRIEKSGLEQTGNDMSFMPMALQGEGYSALKAKEYQQQQKLLRM